MQSQPRDFDEKAIEEVCAQIQRNRLRAAAVNLRLCHPNENGLLLDELGQPLARETLAESVGEANLQGLLSNGTLRKVVVDDVECHALDLNKLLNEMTRLFSRKK